MKKSAEDYANHAESTLSKLGQVYLKKYQDYVRPAEMPRRTLDPSNKKIGSKFSSLFRSRRDTEGTESEVAESEEVGASIMLMIQILLLNSFHGSVSEDDCRKAVHSLNVLRLRRVEILEDGYKVSNILCDASTSSPALFTQSLEQLLLTTTIKDILVKYVDGMMSVLQSHCQNFGILISFSIKLILWKAHLLGDKDPVRSREALNHSRNP